MRVSEVHVRKSEFFTPHVDPYYSNKKYDLHYPKACPQEAERKQCLMTPALLSALENLDVSQLAENVDTDKSRILRYIKSLDEKLNSPQYEFLKEFQPDISCACEETIMADAKCPCPPVKEPMNFNLYEKKRCMNSVGMSRDQCFPQSCYPDGKEMNCRRGARRDPQAERDELLRQTEALQKKLGSPEFGFLYLVPVDLARCACSAEDFPRAECVCPGPVKPTDFRDKHDVKKKIQVMDGLLKSPEFGLSSSCRTYNIGSFAQRSSGNTGGRQQCVPGCPPPPCRCGKDCPSTRGPFEKFPEKTFHVPECPDDTLKIPVPRSPVPGAKACPFSPACCPIADVCPFPVNTIHDPSAPPLPPLQEPRRCPRVPTDPTSINDPSRPDCPLNPLKPTAGSPPGCPLVKPTSCPIGQASGCPLLTCSLGPLKTFIFDGNDECPFCQSKCCPMISPDGPGCPLKVSGNFCPLGSSNICAMKGMSSPPQVVPAAQPEKDEDSCPVGELLAQRSTQQQGFQPTSSCYCAAASSASDPPKRPKDCPLAGMVIRPPARSCPLSTTPSTCPMTKMGSAKFDESCPVSNMFDCPGIKKGALSKLLEEQSASHEESSDHPKKVPRPSKEKSDGNTIDTHKTDLTSQKGESSFKRGSTKAKAKREVSSKPALQQTLSAVTAGKTNDVMRKAVSTVYDTEHTTYNSATLKTNSPESSYFEVSLEPLPRPPLSEYENTRNPYSSRKSFSQRTKTSRRSDREETTYVKASLPDDSKGFQRDGPKPKPKNCPFPEPEKCPLEIPKCPFGPPEPSCPLAKTTNCAARSCAAGMALNAARTDCPVETPACSLFPKGHCPMEDMNTCECDYPVAPCMEPLIPVQDACAPDQYCSKLNCCMGLPLPPTKPGAEFETDTWYTFAEVLPGDKYTKHFLEILNYPPEPEFFVSVNKERKHPAWKIIKHGEGYKHCKKVKELLAGRAPSADGTTQFQLEDLPDDEEIQIIEQNRINSQKAIQNILAGQSSRKEWTTYNKI